MDHFKIVIEYTRGKHKGQVQIHDKIPADQILDTLQTITQYQLNNASVLVKRGAISVPYYDFLYQYYKTSQDRILN